MRSLDIPVFHDDQHGTAIVVLGALTNALRVVDKKLADVRIVLSGAGAAGNAILDLLLAAGATDVVRRRRATASCTPTRGDLDESLARIADRHQPPRPERPARRGAARTPTCSSACRRPTSSTEEDVASMAPRRDRVRPGQPRPGDRPVVARRHAAVVATGRSDFPNQINNVLAFPGVFRGLLDAQSHAIPVSALLAAATALADVVGDDERHANYIVPSVFHPDLATTVAAAVSKAVADAGDDG